jgi:hypothetical protein
MQKSSKAETRKSLLVSLFVLGLIAALFVLPYQFRSAAGGQKDAKGASPQSGIPERLENYDIREHKDDAIAEQLLGYRQSLGRGASEIADIRDKFVKGEENLRRTVRTLKIEYNTDIRIPEVITPDVWKHKMEYLTGPSGTARAEILRNFVKQNNDLVGMTDEQADSLKVIADYTNPDGNLSYAQLDQLIDGIPVFRGEVKAGFTKHGEMIRVINNLAPGLDYSSLSKDFGDPMEAVRAGAGYIKHTLRESDVTLNKAASDKNRAVYGEGDWPTKAEKFYFPTEPGVARAAWRVLIWLDHTAYMMIIDGQTGALLWRKDLGENQTQSATYNVYANTTSMLNALNNPTPLVPGPLDPALGTQGTLVPRTNVTLIGNEAPYTFNNLGWITDGGNVTDGNNVEAGVDRVAPNGVDAPVTGTARVFNFTYTPHHSAGGEDPLLPAFQNGASTNLFYLANRYHDEIYRLGFTEPAFNFQQDNFGRGGLGGDRLSAQAQDSSGTNNANFGNFGGGVVGPDGNRPQTQMFLWTGPTPDRDGDVDNEVIVHELTHGTSSRLHGNTAGITSNMTRGMGEGWSDFYGHAMLSNPSESVNNLYTTGAYATFNLGAGFAANHYYGIRRFPKIPLSQTGGPNNRPYNPFTFKYINVGCDTFIGTTSTAPNSAFPRSPVIATSGSCDQVHNAGEIWSSTLWEVRTLMVTRLGWAVGNRKVLQLVTDGMKLAPLNPTMLQERDAIIAAAAASAAAPEASADVADVREGFRIRGMGFSASVQTVSPAAVTEAFDQANVLLTNPFTVSDSTGDNDGFPEPGENVLLSVAVTNTTGATVNSVTANVNGGTNVSYGNIADGATVTNQIPYTVPPGAVCGSMHDVTINVASAIGSQTPQVRSFRLGAPVGGAPVSFTNSTTITIPATGTGPGASTPYPSNITVSGLSGQKIVKLTFNGYHHEFEDDVDVLLVGPSGQKMVIMSDIGGTTEIFAPISFSIADTGATQFPDATAIVNGTTYKATNIDTTTDAFPAPAPASPYIQPPTAGTATFASAFGTDGAALNGTWSLYVFDDAGSDPGAIDGGWTLTFESDSYFCSTVPRSRADFDGDGKSDTSVFRPSDATWYVNRSTAGFFAVKWGLSTDTLIPGDYDADGKTDAAVYRPTATPGDPDVFVLNSSTSTLSAFPWGNPGDVPVFADYDGDSKTDYAVFRPSNNTWYVFGSAVGNQFTVWGQAGDIPVAGDFDGDGKADLTVFRAGTWITQRTTGGSVITAWGLAGDTLVPADYDGDNKDDLAVFRSGIWHYKKSSDGLNVSVPFGLSSDTVVPGDYDGDGKDDQAVYRNGAWFLNQSTAGYASAAFGLGSDKPVQRAYVP